MDLKILWHKEDLVGKIEEIITAVCAGLLPLAEDLALKVSEKLATGRLCATTRERYAFYALAARVAGVRSNDGLQSKYEGNLAMLERFNAGISSTVQGFIDSIDDLLAGRTTRLRVAA